MLSHPFISTVLHMAAVGFDVEKCLLPSVVLVPGGLSGDESWQPCSVCAANAASAAWLPAYALCEMSAAKQSKTFRRRRNVLINEVT